MLKCHIHRYRDDVSVSLLRPLHKLQQLLLLQGPGRKAKQKKKIKAAFKTGSCQRLCLLTLVAFLATSGKPNLMSVLAQFQLLEATGSGKQN